MSIIHISYRYWFRKHIIYLSMNQVIKKSSVPSKGKASPARQPSANALRRPKRCHLCQKMFAADKYQQHYQSCFRFKDNQKPSIANPQPRANSISGTPSITTKASGFHTTQSRINNSQIKTNTNQAISNKSRLVVNNNVIVPGKATSNITRKGPHKNIVNPSIAQRKFKKDNPEDINKQQKQQQKYQTKKQQSQIEMYQSQIKNGSQIKQEQAQQKIQSRQDRPSSRAIRTHSRPGSATRHQPMQMRVAQQSARLANLYNQNIQRSRPQPPRFHGIEHVEPLNVSIRKSGERRVSLSSQSGYQSSQMIADEVGERTQHYISPARQAEMAVQFPNQRQRQRQIQHERQVEAERQRLRQRAYQLQRQREVDLQRERQRQLARQKERERQRLQIQQERQRQRERQRQQRQRERIRQIQRQRQRQQQRQRQRQRQRDEVELYQTEQAQQSSNLNALVQNTEQIITFIEQLSFNDESLSVMVSQLRQLNAIASQIRQLNGLGRNLGFRMGQVFAERIHQLQNAIMNQIGVVLIRNFHDRITIDFQRLITFSPMQNVVASIGLKKQQIQELFPVKMSVQTNQCSICLQEIKRRQQIRELQCKHTFHPDCIDGWLLQSRRCPMCRHEQKIS